MPTDVFFLLMGQNFIFPDFFSKHLFEIFFTHVCDFLNCFFVVVTNFFKVLLVVTNFVLPIFLTVMNFQLFFARF